MTPDTDTGTNHALSDLSRSDTMITALKLAQIDFATLIAEKAGTSVVIPGADMRAVLDYVERLVAFYNDNTELSLGESEAQS